VLLVQLVGQAVEVGVGRQRLVEGGVEDGNLRNAGEGLERDADAGEVGRVVQRRKDRQLLDVGHYRRGDDDRAGELVAAMDDAMTDGGHIFRVEGEGRAEQAARLDHHLEQVRELELRPFQGFLLGPDVDRDQGLVAVGLVDDAMDVGAAFCGVVDAEVNLADADVECDHLAWPVVDQRQRVGVARFCRVAVVDRGFRFAGAHRANPLGEQARQIGNGLGVGQDVGIEDVLRDQQHEAAVAGDHVGGDPFAGEQ